MSNPMPGGSTRYRWADYLVNYMIQVLSSASHQMLTKENAKSFNVNVGYTVLHSYMTVEDKFRQNHRTVRELYCECISKTEA